MNFNKQKKHVNRLIKKTFKSFGITIAPYPHGDLQRRMMLIHHFHINTIYDVGANIGQYANLVKSLGYKGRIISIEPLSDAFEKLNENSKNDHLWEVLNCGVGDEKGQLLINVSKNSVSSSFQGMLPVHIDESPESVYIRQEKVKVKRFDDIYNEYHQDGDISWLKIDTQGFEMNVLKGSIESINDITAIQLEMSLSQTYQNEIHFTTIMDFLKANGFKLFSIENGYYNKKSGQLYQADGIFFKEHLNQK